jgi:serine protease Do
LACFAAVALLSVSAWVFLRNDQPSDPFEQYYDNRTEKEQTTAEITIPTAPIGQGAELTVSREQGEAMTAQAIYQKVNPSVVTVMVRLDNSMSVGTGVIFTEDGYILTNYHVLEGGEECVIALDTGYTYVASYVAGDSSNDLAIVKIDETGLPAAEFGDSDLLSVGDKVYAIGNPLGVELRGTLTDGIVSAINRDVWVEDRTMTLIQTNAALNSGNSGGPLINEYGQVVGINVIKMTSQYSNVEGLGFAIPTSSMRRIVNDLLTYGEIQPEPLLGITVLTPAEQLADGLWGLKVQEVTAGLAGDLAGIQAGDYILSAAGETTLTSQDLLRVREDCHLGDLLPMTLWRDGEIIEVTLELNDAVEEEEETAPWYVQ